MSCLIGTDSPVVCGEIKTGGVQQKIAVYDWEDWQAATVSQADEDNPITDIVNAVGLKANLVESYDETGIIPDATLREIEGNIDLFDHKVEFPIVLNDQPTRAAFAKGRVSKVVIVAMRGDGTGIVYGKDGGLKLMEWKDLPQDPNLGSILNVVFGTKTTQAGEPYQPTIIDAGDTTSTQAVFDALFVAGV